MKSGYQSKKFSEDTSREETQNKKSRTSCEPSRTTAVEVLVENATDATFWPMSRVYTVTDQTV